MIAHNVSGVSASAFIKGEIGNRFYRLSAKNAGDE
jgi:hypothetical protein